MPIRITALIKKLPTISTEDFHKYWVRLTHLPSTITSPSSHVPQLSPRAQSEQHASIFLSVPIVRANLTRYSQFHIDAPFASSLSQAGIPIAEYDGGAEFWAESYEAAMAVFQDEEYHRVVVPDEMKFLDREKAVMMVGYEEVEWDGGKVVESVKV